MPHHLPGHHHWLTAHRLCYPDREPIEWETPSGQAARVNLQLQFSAFFGYGGVDRKPGYLGLQCHGILWPVMDSDLPHYWPIAPPVISGKVRICGSQPSCKGCPAVFSLLGLSV